MKNTIKSILVAVALLPVSYVQAATVIHAGNAFTGTDDKLTGPVSLIIENDTISEIRKGHIKVGKGVIALYLCAIRCETIAQCVTIALHGLPAVRLWLGVAPYRQGDATLYVT